MPRKFRSKVCRFFNSPFAIWSLSSVILAGITAGWSWFHTSLLERKQDKEKRIALAYEISVRFTDFLKRCDKAESPNEFWAAYDNLEGPQTRLTQFRDATMDELEYQYRLLPAKQDAEVADCLDEGISAIYDLFCKGSGDWWYVREGLENIVENEITDEVKKDAMPAR